MVQVLAACARDPDLVLAGAEAVAALGRRRDVCGHERDQVFSRLEGAGVGLGAGWGRSPWSVWGCYVEKTT